MPEIANVDFISSFKMWSLDRTLSVERIGEMLPNVRDQGTSADGKCTHTWDFTVDGAECSIWDYKGLRWSAYGPEAALRSIGFDPY